MHFLQLLIHALKNGIVQELSAYEDLLRLGAEKKDVLIRNDLDQLEKIRLAEEEGIKKVRMLNTLQAGTLSKIAEYHGLDHTPNLTEIIALVKSEKDKAQLQLYLQRYQRIIIDLQTQTREAQLLLETQMQYTNFMLEMLTQNDTVGDLYSSAGTVTDDPTPRRVWFNQEA